MNIQFTIPEENIVAIYAEDSREMTVGNILAAMPYTVKKLQAMTDSAFSEREFILTDDE